MKHVDSHKLGDFQKTFVVQSERDTFLVAVQSKRAEIHKLSSDNKLHRIHQVDLPSEVLNVVSADGNLVFGLKNGLLVYSLADWTLVTEVTFPNQVAFLKTLNDNRQKTTLALGLRNDSKFTVLLLQNLKVISKIDFSNPVTNLMSDNEGSDKQLDHFLHQRTANLPVHKCKQQACLGRRLVPRPRHFQRDPAQAAANRRLVFRQRRLQAE
jgi:hypothetical protein